MSEDPYQRIEEYKRLLSDCQRQLIQSNKSLTEALKKNAIDKMVIAELAKRIIDDLYEDGFYTQAEKLQILLDDYTEITQHGHLAKGKDPEGQKQGS